MANFELTPHANQAAKSLKKGALAFVSWLWGKERGKERNAVAVGLWAFELGVIVGGLASLGLALLRAAPIIGMLLLSSAALLGARVIMKVKRAGVKYGRSGADE